MNKLESKNIFRLNNKNDGVMAEITTLVATC
jgi:hypothetical protein